MKKPINVFFFLFSVVFASTLFGYDLNQAEIKINIAREDVELSKSSIQEIEAKLLRLHSERPPDQEGIARYENYIARLDKLLAVQEKTLNEMEAVYKTFLEAERAAKPKAEEEDVVDWKIAKEPAVVEGSVEALERELAKSLGGFDDFILKEQASLEEQLDEIEARHAEELEGFKKAVEDAERRSSSGSNADRSETKKEGSASEANSADDPTSTEERSEVEELPPHSSEEGVEHVEAEAASSEGGEAEADGEGSRGDASTDDVVARQLREAAEAETDPVLREKLWKEYQNYKSSL